MIALKTKLSKQDLLLTQTSSQEAALQVCACGPADARLREHEMAELAKKDSHRVQAAYAN